MTHFRGNACGRLMTLCACFTALAIGADPALTIYNQNFAVIRETLPLDLKAGNNIVRFSGATAQVEPDSVILSDPAGRNAIQVVEQNYRNDPVSQELLLSIFEGKTIDFLVRSPDGTERTVTGRIVRSGYVPHYQEQYASNQIAMASGGPRNPSSKWEESCSFHCLASRCFPLSATTQFLNPRSTGCSGPRRQPVSMPS